MQLCVSIIVFCSSPSSSSFSSFSFVGPSAGLSSFSSCTYTVLLDCSLSGVGSPPDFITDWRSIAPRLMHRRVPSHNLPLRVFRPPSHAYLLAQRAESTQVQQPPVPDDDFLRRVFRELVMPAIYVLLVVVCNNLLHSPHLLLPPQEV